MIRMVRSACLGSIAADVALPTARSQPANAALLSNNFAASSPKEHSQTHPRCHACSGAVACRAIQKSLAVLSSRKLLLKPRTLRKEQRDTKEQSITTCLSWGCFVLYIDHIPMFIYAPPQVAPTLEISKCRL